MAKHKGLIGERLKWAREQRGLTQDDLASRIKKAQTQIWRYEAGEVDPSSDVLVGLARELDVSVDFLLGITDSPTHIMTDEPLSPIEKRLLQAFRKGQIVEALEVLTANAKRSQ